MLCAVHLRWDGVQPAAEASDGAGGASMSDTTPTAVGNSSCGGEAAAGAVRQQ